MKSERSPAVHASPKDASASHMGQPSRVRASVVIPTYNRKAPLARLLESLARQTLRREELEVVVVDDGSDEDATAVVAPFADALQVSVLRQENAGVAVARQNGVLRAVGPVIVFLDDDMRVREDFVARHLAVHEEGPGRVVMGELTPDPGIHEMPLFERFYAHILSRKAREISVTGTFEGHDVYTGNLSLPRELFLRVGGFDPAFWLEDAELGVRLEQAGARFVFSRAAAAVHGSDHTSLERWLARNVKDGRDWVRLMRRHPAALRASPWRHLTAANPLARPFFAAALAFPDGAPVLARLVYRGAQGAEAVGLDRVAVAATTVVYGVQYFVGVRRETGTLRDVLRAYLAYRGALRARCGARAA
ncbi:MAG: glycosyltransferase [Myxococcales bacterium]|nr:glycosyltransferase [Myxococcales bacterium]HQY61081.1 glycosyltransferase [Polyangiaceae bacterium]